MNMDLVFAVGFLAVLLVLVYLVPSPKFVAGSGGVFSKTRQYYPPQYKLGFIPTQGERSNYMDCEAIDTKMNVWNSVNGVWKKK